MELNKGYLLATIIVVVLLNVLSFFEEKEYEDNGVVVSGKITRVQRLMGKTYYTYFFKVNGELIQAEDCYTKDIFPRLSKSEEEGLIIKIMYSREDVSHSKIIFDTDVK